MRPSLSFSLGGALVFAASALAGCSADRSPAEGSPNVRRPVATDAAPAAIGPYSQAIEVGQTLYSAGQIGLDPQTGQLVGGGVRAETRRAMENLRAVLSAAGYAMNDVVRVEVFLTDLDSLATMNEVYASYFEADPPARVIVGAARLPRDARIEIALVAAQ